MLQTNLKRPYYNILSDSKNDKSKDTEKIKTDQELINAVGKNIRHIRKSKGKTISDLANMADISAKYLQGVEVGKRNISITNLNRIASVLDIQVGVLFSYDHIEKTKTLLNIANKLKSFSNVQLNNIEVIIEDLNNILQ